MSETLPATLWWSVYISGLALRAVLLCNLGCSWEIILNYFTHAPPLPSLLYLSFSGTSRMLVLPELSSYFPHLFFISLFFSSVPRNFPQLYLWLLLLRFFFFFFLSSCFLFSRALLLCLDISSVRAGPQLYINHTALLVLGSLSVPEQGYSVRALWIS